MDNFGPINGIAAIVAGLLVKAALGKRPRWVQWSALLLVAVGVGGALGFAEQFVARYEERHDPAAASAAVESEMLKLSPFIVIVKRDDPVRWQAFISELGRQLVSSGGNLTAADEKWWQEQLGAMVKDIWRYASMSDDAAVLAIGRQEVAVDEVLQRQTVQMCATRGSPQWNLNSLPPDSLKAVQEFMTTVGNAYQQGKGKQNALPTDAQVQGLIREAVFLKEAPLSQDDAAYLFSGDATDAARTCRVRLQFERNILAIPEGATLLRFLYSQL